MAEVTIRDYLNKVITAKEQLPDAVNNALFQNEAKIVDLNKAQLYDGKDIFGNEITEYGNGHGKIIKKDIFGNTVIEEY